MPIFLGGLPRSSSTVLAALLNQNPEFHVGPTSPMLNLVTAVRNTRTSATDFRALDKESTDIKMKHVLKGIIGNWYADRPEPVCFDKCRGWLEFYPMLTALVDAPKVIVPIRDLRGVLASMEMRRIANPTMSTKHGDNIFDGVTVQSRVDQYLNRPPVGIAIERLYEALQRGYLDNMCVVRAEDLGANPEGEMRKIYTFLGIPWFEGHTYTGIASVANEHDHVHAPYGEHSVRNDVQAPSTQWEAVLGKDVCDDIVQRCDWFYKTFYPEVKA